MDDMLEDIKKEAAPGQKAVPSIQDSFLNGIRKDRAVVTVFLLGGEKLIGKLKSFDRYSLVLETNGQEQLIFKHAISTVATGRAGHHNPPQKMRATEA